MNVSDAAKRVNVISKIPDIVRHDSNPFRLLPDNMAMVSHDLLWHIMKHFCTPSFAFKIKDLTPSIGGYSDVEDVIRVYNRHRAPDIEIGIFFNTERDNSHNERAIRQVLTNMGWTAGELADEYDRQHSAPATSINTGNKALDDVVNDILARHGRDAAVAYLQGLKAKNINKG